MLKSLICAGIFADAVVFELIPVVVDILADTEISVVFVRADVPVVGSNVKHIHLSIGADEKLLVEVIEAKHGISSAIGLNIE